MASKCSDSTAVMDPRKRKRMESNRESARRSRLRKQKLMGDLNSQVAELQGENDRILSRIDVTIQHLLNIEAENSILKAQVMELSQRLVSLNEILGYICSGTNGVPSLEGFESGCGSGNGFTNTDGMFGTGCPSHPIMATPAEAMMQY